MWPCLVNDEKAGNWSLPLLSSAFFHHKEGVVALAFFGDGPAIAKGDDPVHFAGSILGTDEAESPPGRGLAQT